jgi:hypothetical protein
MVGDPRHVSATAAATLAQAGVRVLMRILIRTSKWAVWARRTGALALPLAAIPVLLHRAHVVTSDNFITIETIALGLAALAVAMAIVAFVRLWFTGDQGWWKASLAFIFGVLCLAPAGYFGYLAIHQPSMPDVSTDFTTPPTLLNAAAARPPDAAQIVRVEADFPNARSRNYPIAAPAMFDAVSDLIDDRGWDVLVSRKPATQVDSGEINAIVTTLLGFRQEVAIRVTGAPDGTTIAMRSASLTNFPDFGENGQRVEDFMLDLDNQVTLMLRTATPAAPADTN